MYLLEDMRMQVTIRFSSDLSDNPSLSFSNIYFTHVDLICAQADKGPHMSDCQTPPGAFFIHKSQSPKYSSTHKHIALTWDFNAATTIV